MRNSHGQIKRLHNEPGRRKTTGFKKISDPGDPVDRIDLDPRRGYFSGTLNPDKSIFN
jgi:hypothetical protein